MWSLHGGSSFWSEPFEAIEEGTVFPGRRVWPWVNALFSWDSSCPLAPPAPGGVIPSFLKGNPGSLLQCPLLMGQIRNHVCTWFVFVNHMVLKSYQM